MFSRDFLSLRRDKRGYNVALSRFAAQLPKVLSSKGQGLSHHKVENHPQTPLIHQGSCIVLAQEEFWGSMNGAATEDTKLVTLVTLIAEAKVCNFHVHLGIKGEVPWLQVLVHDAHLVAVLQSRDQMPECASDLCLCHVAMVLYLARHVPPTEVLHVQEQRFLSVSHLQQLYSIGVIQTLHNVDFPEKSQEAGGALLTFLNNLDGYLCPSQNVPGQLHLGNVTFTNGVEDLIVVNMSLLISRDGLGPLHHGGLLTTPTDSTN